MATCADLQVPKFDDKTITIQISPITAIGSWDFQFTVRHRFNGESGLIVKKSVALSGTGGGQSGITVNSGGSSVNVAIKSLDTSGLDQNIAYTFDLERVNSGFHTIITNGYFLITPSDGP